MIYDNFGLYNQSMAGFFNESKSPVINESYRMELLSKCRVVYDKIPLAKTAIDVMLRGIIGSGLKLKTTDENINRIICAVDKTRLLDTKQESNLFQIQQIVAQTLLTCGECFLIKFPSTLRLSEDSNKSLSTWTIVEPDYIQTPPHLNGKTSIIDGFEFDKLGRVEAIYYNSNLYNPARQKIRKSDWIRIERNNFLHIKLTGRPGYHRALPPLAPLLENLYGLYSFQTAQIQMGIIQSTQAFVIKLDSDPSLRSTIGLTTADLDAPIYDSSSNRNQTDTERSNFTICPPNNRDTLGLVSDANYVRAGESITLKPGESIDHLPVTGPSNNLMEYYNLVTEQVASCLGIPHAILRGVFDTSFSSSKCSVAQWNYTINKYITLINDQLLNPILRQLLIDFGYDTTKAAEISINSVWAKTDPTMLLDETRSARFTIDCLNNGLLTRGEARERLFGVNAGEIS